MAREDQPDERRPGWGGVAAWFSHLVFFLPRELPLALGMVCGMNWHDLEGPKLIWIDQGNRTCMPLKKLPAALLSREQVCHNGGFLQANLSLCLKRFYAWDALASIMAVLPTFPPLR